MATSYVIERRKRGSFSLSTFLEEVNPPIVGRRATMGAPFRYASVERWLKRAAPVLGEHNAEILHELGYDEGEIEVLAAKKVIGDRPEGV